MNRDGPTCSGAPFPCGLHRLAEPYRSFVQLSRVVGKEGPMQSSFLARVVVTAVALGDLRGGVKSGLCIPIWIEGGGCRMDDVVDFWDSLLVFWACVAT